MTQNTPAVHLILQCTIEEILTAYDELAAALYAALQRMTVAGDWIERLEGPQKNFGLVTIEPQEVLTKPTKAQEQTQQ